MHKIAVIVNVDNDTCAYIDGKLCAGNLKYISFDKAKGANPRLIYAVDEDLPNNGSLEGFLYLLGCILQGWDSVESSQPKEAIWFDALKQLPIEQFANLVFEVCQRQKDSKSFETLLTERVPENLASTFHLINSGAVSLIPGYGLENNDNSHWGSGSECKSTDAHSAT